MKLLKSLIEVLQSTSCLINEEKLIKAINLLIKQADLYILV